jgi:hypothetical protein
MRFKHSCLTHHDCNACDSFRRSRLRLSLSLFLSRRQTISRIVNSHYFIIRLFSTPWASLFILTCLFCYLSRISRSCHILTSSLLGPGPNGPRQLPLLQICGDLIESLLIVMVDTYEKGFGESGFAPIVLSD